MFVPGEPPGARFFILDRRRRGWLTGREWALFTLLVLPAGMALAARLDNTWKIPQGVGFSQHLGFALIFGVTPVLLLLTSYVLETFVATLQCIDDYCVPFDVKVRQELATLTEKHVQYVTLRGDTAPLLVFVVIGFLFWIIWNIVHTIDPIPTYGHDVFDAWAHRYGFFAAKLYVLVALAVVWSVAIFVSTQATYSMISVLWFLKEKNALQVNVFHHDNCGGTSMFGWINLAITAIIALLLLVVLAMAVTHQRTYAVLYAGFLGCTLFVFAQSIGAVYAMHQVLMTKKNDCLLSIATTLNAHVIAEFTQPSTQFRYDLLAYRSHLLRLNTFPYARSARVLINVLRAVPVVAGVITFARSL